MTAPILRTARVATLLLACTACTRPDVTTEIAAAGRLLSDIDTRLGPSLRAAVQGEIAAAETAIMRENRQVLSLEGACDLLALEEAGGDRLDCALVSDASPPDTISAHTTLETIVVLRGYLAALQALATSDSPAAVETNATALSAALSQDGAARVAAFRALAGALAGRQRALAATLGFIARQRQSAGLRRAVRDADPVVAELTDAAVAYFRLHDREVAARYQALLLAADRVDDADVLADPALNRGATDALRAAYRAYRAAESASPVSDLVAFRRLHGALRDRLVGRANQDEILALLDELSNVLGALEPGG